MLDQKQKFRQESYYDSNQNLDRGHEGNPQRTIIHGKAYTPFPKY